MEGLWTPALCLRSPGLWPVAPAFGLALSWCQVQADLWACFADAGCVQVGSHPETCPEGETGYDAALRPEAAQGADQVLGAAVEEK